MKHYDEIKLQIVQKYFKTNLACKCDQDFLTDSSKNWIVLVRYEYDADFARNKLTPDVNLTFQLIIVYE